MSPEALSAGCMPRPCQPRLALDVPVPAEAVKQQHNHASQKSSLAMHLPAPEFTRLTATGSDLCPRALRGRETAT